MKQTPTTLPIIAIAKRCARISLATGTMIFIAFAISKAEALIIVGFFFTFIACAANGIALLVLLLHLTGNRPYWQQIFNAIIIVLSNIPIAIFFAWLSIQISELNHIKL